MKRPGLLGRAWRGKGIPKPNPTQCCHYAKPGIEKPDPRR
jgi:hypothetical protein